MQKLGHLAYHKLNGNGATLVFLHGFRSDMEGAKALYLDSFCAEIGQSFIRFDCSGHGKSEGEFKSCTIGHWLNDTLKIIDELTNGNVILVGSSMGGWLMLLAALARPQIIRGLIGIATAPDFTENLMWKKFSKKEQEQIQATGEILIPNCYDGQEPYPITKKLIEESRRHLLLDQPINITCPVRLIHGMQDRDVPFETTLDLSCKLKSDDVEIHLVKNGDHRLSAPENLELLRQQVLSMIRL